MKLDNRNNISYISKYIKNKYIKLCYIIDIKCNIKNNILNILILMY